MDNFRNFLGSTPVDRSNCQTGKWDVVLFTGTYSPITKDEHGRIQQFVNNIIRGDKYKHLFSETVELGLVFDDEDDNTIRTELDMVLNNEEKNFITTKIFGLRGFTVSYRKLKWLTIPIPDKSKLKMNADIKNEKMKGDMLTMYTPALEDIKKNFDQVNVLVVINPEEDNALPELDHIVTNFEDDTIKIGFMSWKHISNNKIKELGNIPVTGDMIKAVVLLDHERPNPQDLKAFAYKYGLKSYIDHIRALHFRVNGEYYLEAFMSLFPDLIIYDDDESNMRQNYKVVLEVLKKTYFKDNYVSPYVSDVGMQPATAPSNEEISDESE